MNMSDKRENEQESQASLTTVDKNQTITKNRQQSSFKRLLDEAKFGLLRFIVGSNAQNCMRKSLKENENLSRFTPSNSLELLMTQPSDIWEHLATLHMLTIEFNLKTTLELGTAEGESTSALLYASKQIGGNVYSIDINPCQEARETIKNLALFDRWNFIQGDDLQVNWSKEIDHLFIDTSHEYNQTLEELRKYEPYVRSGGIITLHDIISCPEVFAAISEYTRNRNDLRIYKYFHNNGLAVIFKGKHKNH
jgi:predicted O-methyltransferase YrrM